MKSMIIVLVTVMLFSIKTYSQTNYYYYYKNEKKHFQVNTNKAYLQLSENIEVDELAQLLGNNVTILDLDTDIISTSYSLDEDNEDGRSLPIQNYWAIIHFNENLSEHQYFSNLEEIREKTAVSLVMPYLLNSKGNEVGISQYVYVKLNSNQDFSLLEQVCETYNLNILGKYPNRQWYIVECTSTTQFNTIEIAALLHEQNIFSAVEPDLMSDIYLNCVDNPNQWGLNSTGNQITVGNITFTPTIDINICPLVFSSLTGELGSPDVKVAVFDSGIELHNDLNFSSQTPSYDVHDDDVGTVYSGFDSHGTKCAGIIGGIPNQTGISGIASNSTLISISANLVGGRPRPRIQKKIARGFDFAVEQGVDVINCSWSWDEDNPSQTLDDAITNALDNGRNGLGMVVVFASGNDNGAVGYPGNSNNNILTVGAMSPCAERINPNSCNQGGWGSNFGSELDIVAPGAFIPTTTENNGIVPDFGGTSAAAPHVTGVAALILAENPCLTGAQVRDIIESTAQKEGSYNYMPTAGRPNGSWHEEVGYGLLDAYESLQYMKTLFLQDQIDVGTEFYESIGRIRTGSDVKPITGIAVGDYVVGSGADIVLKATEEIKLEVGTKIANGATFRAYTDNFNGNCNDWLLPRTVPTDNPTIEDNVVVTDKSNNINENIKQQVDVTIYPNPFENNFNLGINLTQSDDYSLNVFNATGQLIYTQNGQLDIGKHLLKIPINQGNGLCIVRLQIGDKIVTKKLMKYE